MKTDTFFQSPELNHLVKNHFTLLQSENPKKNLDSVSIRLSGYADVIDLTADLLKVSMMALDTNSPFPEPEANIRGVLSIVLDLLPYEEAALLDKLRHQILSPSEPDWNFILQTVTLSPPPIN
ncbi:hypothetical protein HUK80_17370 [Flavobacterium sp. MAH-1]|uniref:Uncharacterized protein n=1 Tax=Flavobacterium agri TaxID=2743471 RepID=A0A7Y8Y4Z5_9FLAO|nr:hypothetical protein [Flavobacterium agri]NUY82676.1 hypothetical protein [Flavobacterium agri]NYA72699.1 hypothetical protein [Flavobacterium agri]